MINDISVFGVFVVSGGVGEISSCAMTLTFHTSASWVMCSPQTDTVNTEAL